jgi:small subunit ribosomal protein S10
MSPTSKKEAAKKPAKKSSRKKVTAKKEDKKREVTGLNKKDVKDKIIPKKLSGIRIRVSAFDHRVLDEAAAKIIDTAERSGAVIHGPVPLPTKIRKFTVNRSTFVHKNARDQFEMRIHSRLIDLTETTFKTVESLQSLSLPSGVDIDIKMK